MGRLAGLLAETAEPATPLQIQLDGLGKRLALIAAVVVA
jgi:Ca2+-transporting ATPase